MGILPNGRADYLARLIEINELAIDVVERDECWRTESRERSCGDCPMCRLTDAIDRNREEPSE